MSERNAKITFSADISKLINGLSAVVKDLSNLTNQFSKSSQASDKLKASTDRAADSLNELERDAANLENQLKDVAGQSNKAGNELDELNKKGKLPGLSAGIGSIKNMIGIVAGLAAVAKSVEFAFSSINAADQLQDLADKSRLSIREVQELQFVAERSGTSFDTLSGSLTKLELAQSQAIGGSDDFARAFKALNVEFKNADGTAKDKVELFKDIADGLKGISDESLKTEISTKLFGRSFSELEGVLSQGKEGINGVIEEGEKFRSKFSEDAVEASGKFNDAIDDLSNNLKVDLVNSLSGVIAKVADVISKFNEASRVAGGFFSSIGTTSLLSDLGSGSNEDQASKLRENNSQRKVGRASDFLLRGLQSGFTGAQDPAVIANEILQQKIIKEKTKARLDEKNAAEQLSKILAENNRLEKLTPAQRKAEQQKTDAAARKTLKGEEGSKGGSSGGGSARDVIAEQLRAESDLYRSQSSLLIEIEKGKNAIMLEQLKSSLSNQEVTLTQFLARQRDIKTSEIDAEIAEKQRQRGVQEQLAQRASGDAAREAEARRKIIDIDREIIALENRKAIEIERTNTAIQKQQEVALDLATKLREEYSKITGDIDVQAASSKVEQSYKAQLSVLNDIEDQQLRIAAIQNLEATKELQLININMQAQDNKFKKIEQLTVKQAEVNARLEAQRLGIAKDETELFVLKRKEESLRKLRTETEQYIATLQEQKALESDSAVIEIIDKQILKYKELSVTINDQLSNIKTIAQETGDIIDDSLNRGFSNFDITKPRESFNKLLGDLNADLLNFFTKKAFDQIKGSIFGEGGSIGKTLTGQGGGEGGILSQLFGNANNTLSTSLQPVVQTFDTSLKSVTDTTGQTFSGILSNFGSGFSNIFSSLSQSLSGLFSGGGGGIGGGLGSIFSSIGGGLSGITSGIGSFFGGFLASGGLAMANTPYVVGENGPELFVPNTSGRVVDSQNTQKAMQGGNVTINISTPDADSFRKSSSQILTDAQRVLQRQSSRNR